MRIVNVHSVPLDRDEGDPLGYAADYLRLGPLLDSSKLGATIYELPPGQSNCPYHYELGNEEWLLVIEGVLTVRHPDGEQELVKGDLVCFPDGPAGAHKLTNRSGTSARALMFSTSVNPSASVYPDSGKIGIWPAPGSEDSLIVRRESGVDYWDGEVRR